MLYFDDENAAPQSTSTISMGESHVLDLAIHEPPHGLIRLNNVELGHDIEELELVVDVSSPDGYLSKIIGLVDEVNARLETSSTSSEESSGTSDSSTCS